MKTQRRVMILFTSILVVLAAIPFNLAGAEDGRPPPDFTLPPTSESDPTTAQVVWYDAGTWINPITKAVYTVQKRSILPNYVFDGSDPISPVRYTSPTGDVYSSWQDAVEAEIAAAVASGTPASVFKASESLRAAYAEHNLTARPVLIVLKNQPVFQLAPGIWASHKAELDAANERARTNTDPNLAEQYAQDIENILQTARREIFQAATPVILTSQADAILNLTLAGFPGALPVGKTLSIVRANITPATLDKLTNVPDVLTVDDDVVLTTQLDVATSVTGQPSFVNNGFNGGAMDVAVVDTGIDFTHPTYDVRGWTAAGVFLENAKWLSNFCDSATDTTDRQGHGTAVAGPVMSLGSSGWENHKGMVPSTTAGLISAKAFYKTCSGSDGGAAVSSDIIQAVDWAVNDGPENNLVAEVISFSAGSKGGGASGTIDLFFDSVSWALGIPVVAASGNDGSAAGSIGSPGSTYNVIAVGYASDRNTASRSDDGLMVESSRGPTTDGRLKPDIIAPGDLIKTPNYKWAGFLQPDYVDYTGSSLSAPFISGAAALNLHAGFGGPVKIKATLMNSANRNELGGTGVPSNNIGHGYVNLGTQYSRYVTNNYYQSGTFNDDFPATTNAVAFIRLASPISSDALTLYWERHVGYTPENPGSTLFPAADLDMYVYREGTNGLQARSDGDVNNYEFLRGSDFGSVSDNVIKVRWTQVGNGGLDHQAWGLASSFTLNTLTAPALSLGTLNVPSRLVNGGTATITQTVSNTGGLRAHNVQASLSLPPGFSFASGSSPTVSLGAIDASSSATASWTVNVPTTPCATDRQFSASASSTSYGETFSTPTSSATSRINCVPSVTVSTPNGGDAWRGTRSITWTQSDGDTGDTLSVTVSYKRDTSSSWATICSGLSSSPCNWDTTGATDATNYRVRVEATDSWNTGTDQSDNTFTVDNTVPQLGHSESGTAGNSPWYRSAVTVTMTCTDATSGVSTREWRKNDGAWNTYTEPFTISDEGVTDIDLRCLDVAGNEASTSIPLSIDTRKPTSSASLSGVQGDNGWFRASPVTVTLTCSDPMPGSGCSSQQWRMAGSSTWNTYTGPFDVSGEGIKNVEHRAIDVAGWTGVTTTTPVKIDSVAPSSTASTPSESKTSDSFTVSWSSSDPSPASGIACTDIDVQDNGGTWTRWKTCHTGTSDTYTGVQGHTYGFRARAKDEAGNLGNFPATAQTTTYVNRAPTAEAGQSQSVSFVDNLVNGVTVDGTGSSDSDGSIVEYCWSWGESGSVPPTCSTSPTANHKYAAAGTYTVTLTVKDDDGRTGSDTTTITVRSVLQG